MTPSPSTARRLRSSGALFADIRCRLSFRFLIFFYAAAAGRPGELALFEGGFADMVAVCGMGFASSHCAYAAASHFLAEARLYFCRLAVCRARTPCDGFLPSPGSRFRRRHEGFVDFLSAITRCSKFYGFL